MTHLFYSHSKHDKKILTYFDEIFARTNLSAFRASLEDFPRGEDPSKTIEDAIKESVAVFVLLGSGILKSQFTMSWVGYEVGLAKAWMKPVWVFEWIEDMIDFPTPHVDHYILYSMEEFRPYLRDLIEAYETGLLGILPKRPLQAWKWRTGGKEILCGNCSARFYIYQDLPTGWKCPACRRDRDRFTL